MTQPTALFLADILEDAGKPADIADKCVAELRRLHAENAAASTHLSELMKDLVKVETQRDALITALHNISLASQDSGSTREGMGLYARAAIKKAADIGRSMT